MATRHSLVGVVEAAYRLDGTEREWLSGVLESARPHLDRGRGIFGYFFELPESGPLRVSEPILSGASAGIVEIFAPLMAAADEPVLARTFRSAAVCATVTELLGADVARKHPAWAMVHPYGVRDNLGIRVADPAGPSAFLSVPLPRATRLSPAVRASWERIAAHMAAALRLRRALVASTSEERSPVEAVLTPEGKTAHATGQARTTDARAALRDAVLAMQRARGTLRSSNPNLAVAIWRGLVDGRWSLVDSFESDGKRHVIARKNDPKVVDPRGLTLRERQIIAYARLGHSNKLIGYELGLSASSVATHLARALVKLGLRSRSELFHHLG